MSRRRTADKRLVFSSLDRGICGARNQHYPAAVAACGLMTLVDGTSLSLSSVASYLSPNGRPGKVKCHGPMSHSDSACNRPCVRRLPRREEAGTPTVSPAARCGRSFGEPQAIEQAGALLRFLPPYSPDFNPIELAFAKLKAFLRAARPRTFDHVCQLMAAALGLFMPDECANYVRHCGYRVTT